MADIDQMLDDDFDDEPDPPDRPSPPDIPDDDDDDGDGGSFWQSFKPSRTGVILAIVIGLMAGFVPGLMKIQKKERDVLKTIAEREERTRPERQIEGTRQEADEFFRLDEFDRAYIIYQSLGGETAKRPDDLLYRMAVCEEALGKFDDAVANFQALAARDDTDEVTRMAGRVGKARVLLRQENYRDAVSLLGRLVLLTDDENLKSHPIKADVNYLFALGLSNLIPRGAEDIRSDRLSRAPQDWPVTRAALWVTKFEEQAKRMEPLKENSPTAAFPAWLRKSSELLFGKTERPLRVSNRPAPESAINVEQAQISVTSLLEKVADQKKLELEISTAAQQAIREGSVRISVENFPLNVALSGILETYQTTWAIDDSKLSIKTSGELTPEEVLAFRSQTAQKALQHAISTFPEHYFTTRANLEIGNVHYLAGNYAEADSAFTKAAGRKSTLLHVAAAFNLGLTQRQLGQRDAARESFLKVVDGAPGHPLTPRGFYILGRMYLDEGRYDESVQPLRRASAVNPRLDRRGLAAAQLAIAHVMKNELFEAGRALVKRKKDFNQIADLLRQASRNKGLDKDSPFDVEELRRIYNAAALVNAYATFRHLTTSATEKLHVGHRGRVRDATTDLINALVSLGEKVSWMGPAGMVVVGRAYRDLDLGDRMDKIFKQALPSVVFPELRAEMEYSIADFAWRDADRRRFDADTMDAEISRTSDEEHAIHLADARQKYLDEAVRRDAEGQELFEKLAKQDISRWLHRARYRLAQHDLKQGRYRTCLERCYQLAGKQQFVALPDVLLIMGQAYEQLGADTLAMTCYRGELPEAAKAPDAKDAPDKNGNPAEDAKQPAPPAPPIGAVLNQNPPVFLRAVETEVNPSN